MLVDLPQMALAAGDVLLLWRCRRADISCGNTHGCLSVRLGQCLLLCLSAVQRFGHVCSFTALIAQNNFGPWLMDQAISESRDPSLCELTLFT